MINVDHISKLARLGLSAQEKNKLEKELPAILEFINKLNEIKTDKVEPTAQVTGLKNIVREDKGEKRTKQEAQKLLDLAPETKDDYVKVKAIL
ncbi:MAG: Asp-tRNA(Asn)/Glu-tRNA(Gln) amidotransferase subunit GatC [Parcubacteria group bacterium]|nr:Asp-tRNA(Asn)/Glu-tRNA(Gln) amidotransferase subunit GatC [Parcubacteria group bacterium]